VFTGVYELQFVSDSFSGHLFPLCVSVCITRNLTTIDESGSVLSSSDISFDKTEEDFDGDVPVTRAAKRPLAPPPVVNDDDADDDAVAVPSGKRSRHTAVGIYVECFLWKQKLCFVEAVNSNL